jgi:hypothetical protein
MKTQGTDMGTQGTLSVPTNRSTRPSDLLKFGVILFCGWYLKLQYNVTGATWSGGAGEPGYYRVWIQLPSSLSARYGRLYLCGSQAAEAV